MVSQIQGYCFRLLSRNCSSSVHSIFNILHKKGDAKYKIVQVTLVIRPDDYQHKQCLGPSWIAVSNSYSASSPTSWAGSPTSWAGSPTSFIGFYLPYKSKHCCLVIYVLILPNRDLFGFLLIHNFMFCSNSDTQRQAIYTFYMVCVAVNVILDA